MGAHKLCRHFAMRRNPILCAVSPVSQNLCGQYLNDFYIFLAGKYASFRHSAYYRNHYGRLSHLREKYGKSPPEILSIFTSRQHKFWPNIFFWVHMSRHNGNYRMVAFYWYVLCIGILLSWHANDVMFLGCKANLGTQKNYATETLLSARWKWYIVGTIPFKLLSIQNIYM